MCVQEFQEKVQVAATLLGAHEPNHLLRNRACSCLLLLLLLLLLLAGSHLKNQKRAQVCVTRSAEQAPA
jgi:hypothetical protein